MKESLKQKAHDLPLVPGVYLMRDAAGVVIYVGKAKSLRSRVSQYFAGLASHTPKTRRLVEQIDDFDTIVATSEFDALLLENTLIKKHKPKYNILLKDDKGYPFIRIAPGDFARMSVVGSRAQDGARYFGPYVGRGAAHTAIDTITGIFALPTCSRVFPRDIGRDRPCLNYHMKKCCGVCRGEVSAAQYDELMRQAALLLSGKSDWLIEALNDKMQQSADALDFESAAQYRDKIRVVDRVTKSRTVTGIRMSELDVLCFAAGKARACITVLSYIDGSLVDKRTRFFDGLGEDDGPDALESFIKQYYPRVGHAPAQVALSHEIEDTAVLSGLLSSLAGRKCEILTPKRGGKRRLTELGLENARHELFVLETQEQKSLKTLERLTETLKLPAVPDRIEAYDISNTAGADAVGSMTVFALGRAKKSAYKRFRIKQAAAGDDYGSMAEVLGRRLDRALAGDAGFLPLPGLILIDGGQGQVSAARAQMTERAVALPVFGMVKDARHRTRALVSPDGAEIGLEAIPQLFAFIGRIQEETHRFAIEYHRQLRGKTMKASALDGIAGLGEKRKRELLRHFGTVKAVRAAEFEALCAALPKNVARSVHDHFHPSSEGKEKQI